MSVFWETQRGLRKDSGVYRIIELVNGHNLSSMRQPYFFKVFLPNLSPEHLRIPVDFYKHLEEKTSGTVSLMGPSGNNWHAKLVKRHNGLFFEDGWSVFVRDHYIQIGDFFVFRYDGNLHFTVLIFDRSACEKEAAFSVRCSQDTTEISEFEEKKRKIEVTEDVLNAPLSKIFGGVSKRRKGNSPQALSDSMTKNLTTEKQIFDKSICKIEGIANSPHGSVYNSRMKWGRPPRRSVGFNDDPGQHLPFPKGNKVSIKTMVVAQKRIGVENVNLPMHEMNPQAICCLTRRLPSIKEERAEAWNAGNTFMSNFPYFIKCMTDYHVRRYMGIPSSFSSAHLESSSMKIIIRNTERRSWTVSLIYYNGFHNLIGGWPSFIDDNKIKIGDILIFELVGKAELLVSKVRLVNKVGYVRV